MFVRIKNNFKYKYIYVLIFLIFVGLLQFSCTSKTKVKQPNKKDKGFNNEVWVKRYNKDLDYAKAIAVDKKNNIYVTGMAASDFITIKYDSEGNQKWLKRYNGPANKEDLAKAIVIDEQNNVYVTGISQSSENDKYDYATVKYDTNGNQKWVKRYNAFIDENDAVITMAIDKNNNIYVAGESFRGSNTLRDYTAIKYDSNGKLRWVRIFNGSASGDDLPKAIAIDKDNNIYVTGGSQSSGSEELVQEEQDYITIKFDTNGNAKWIRNYNGPSNGDDYANAIQIDKNSNIYITGASANDSYNYDYTTVKYDTKGNRKWVKRYNGPSDEDDFALAMVIDSNSNVYVAGEGEAGTTIKYDTNGNQKWLKRYEEPANSLAVDSNNNIYVLGGGDDYTTIKYNTNGSRIWVNNYNGPANDEDLATAIAIDKANNIYVTGESIGRGNSKADYLTIKY